MERGKAMFGKSTFVMDRGYDDNKMFLKVLATNKELKPKDDVIRIARLYFSRWFLALISMKPETNALKISIMQRAVPIIFQSSIGWSLLKYL